VGVQETKSENTYLKALATYGIGMLFLTLVMVLVSARLMWRLFRLRRWLDPDRQALVDMIIAFNAMYFAASLFEGVMDARVSSYLVLMLILSAMVANLLRQEAESAALADHGDFEDLSDWDDSYGYEVNEEGADVDYDERT
jgi:O-antigen ligase